MAAFDAEVLSALRAVREVAIRTDKHPENAVVIWIVVVGDEVFVRSWLGARGRWYRDLAAGGNATLEFAGRQLRVRAIPAGKPGPIDRASRQFLEKYRSSSHAQEMVHPETLPTTLRLEPR